jgi:hypothetical protein
MTANSSEFVGDCGYQSCMFCCKQCIGTPAQGAWCMLAVDVGLAWLEIALCRRYIMSLLDAGG